MTDLPVVSLVCADAGDITEAVPAGGSPGGSER